MDNKLFQMIEEYLKVIQKQIDDNITVLAGVSQQIEKSKKTNIETTDPDILHELVQENLQAIRKINLHIKKQEELILKFRRISGVYADEINLNDINLLHELLEHYEQVENYEHCAVLRDKISINKQVIDDLNNISNKGLLDCQ